jgi:signal transduction histidine kinase
MSTQAMTLDGVEMSSDRSVVAALIELASVDRGDWEGTVQHILRVEARVLEVERISLWTLREEQNCFVCEMAYHRTTGVFERGYTLAFAEHRDYMQAVKTPPLVVEDVRSDPRLRSLRAYFDAREISSVLDFPLLAHGDLAGVLCVQHVGPTRRWSASDVQFAAAIAQSAAAALEARERARAQEATRRAAFLDQTSRELGGTLDVDEVGRRAIALAMPRLADGVQIDLIDGDVPRLLAFGYVTAEGRALLEKAMPERSGEPYYLLERVTSHRGSLLLPDFPTLIETEDAVRYPKLFAALRALGTRSLMAAPLFVGEQIIGIVTFVTSKRAYELDDLGLAEAFAQRFAGSLENAILHRRAHDAVRVRDEFIALAGHELRTPLTALLLAARDLQRRSPNASREDLERLTTMLVKQVQRLDRLCGEMLDATQISGGQPPPLTRAPTDLAEMARDGAEVFAPVLCRQGSSLVVRADAPVVGQWDAAQIERVLSILLDNAAKFGAGRPVEIDVRREGEDATLSVSDHGPGIPPDRIQEIFAPFERAVSAAHYGGLGLGLFIARAIVDRHGGRLTVDNRPGQGATFTARLPLRERSTVRPPSPPSPASGTPSP